MGHSSEWAEQASQANRRRRRSDRSDQAAQRAIRAQNLILLGEVSAGRQALEGAELAPGTQATSHALCDREKRPPILRELLPHDLWTCGGELDLDEAIFTKNVRSARRGAASGPQGMTFGHLRPIFQHPQHAFLVLGCRDLGNSSGATCNCVCRPAGMTALQKRNGGVRGVVGGDALRRLVARTIAQQLSGSRSGHLWEDACSVAHRIHQGARERTGRSLDASALCSRPAPSIGGCTVQVGE